MATITKSIGTSSRDYSTITAWEADLDNTGIYTSGDDAVGECYNDTAFDESVGIDGGSTVGLNSIKLTAANGEKHDGTEGTGARIVSSTQIIFIGTGGSVDKTISFIEVDRTTSANANFTMISLTGSAGSGATNNLNACIVHGAAVGTQNYRSLKGIATGSVAGITYNITNNIVYDITHASGGNPAGITTSTGNIYIYNCTVHNITEPGGTTGSCFSVTCNDLRNCIATDCSGNDFATGTISGTESNNLSSDSTASGTGSLTGKTAANQFVSTVAGSEDLHLLSTADAVGAGVDLATTSIDINGSDRNALTATVWDIGAHQYASTASIGTSSRDYSTITLWEADLDDTTIYGAGANAVGECYNDSDFNEVVNINGGGTSTTGLNSIKLTVAEADRHDGTAGTGARMVYNSKIQMYSDVNIEVYWLEIDWGGTSSGGNQFSIVYTHNNSYQQKIAYMLIHDAQTASSGRMIQGKYGYLTIINNIIYNLTHTGPYRGYGILVDSYRTSYAYNNTVHNIASTHASAAYTFGIHLANSNNVRNNIATEVGDGIYSGCFGNVAAGTNSNNMSTDGTAPGSNSKTNQPVSRQFVSTLSGSEDLHLIFKSAAIDAGVDLGTTPDGVQYDINGKDRDAENSIWDIGAHEYGDNVVFGLLRV